MNDDANGCGWRGTVLRGMLAIAVAMAAAACPLLPTAAAQDASKADGEVAGVEQPVAVTTVEAAKTTPERQALAWAMLNDALRDMKRPQTRIQALAAVGMLRNQRSEDILRNAMTDPDLDVRTAAALAAGQTKDRNLTTPLRALLDDKEPQVVFTAAVTLWKMGDRSGEDVLESVVDGDRSANPTLVHGTEHTISRDLHDPAKLARLGAMQGAYMLLGPFGFGITAFNYIHSNGGDVSRVQAIELIAQEHIEPVHKELIAALGDKDPAVRAAAAKALSDWRDAATAAAVYPLLGDSKQPVRLTSAAAYLRTTGVPGPVESPSGARVSGKGKG